ncbi:DUF742 domain-containing protein [Streptomyces zaomyceticus]|uniref:DUF742 domain-containing protein n=1 Tax=Streptomyces zaomyceticus TaxID=68286 RepID=UPI003680A006
MIAYEPEPPSSPGGAHRKPGLAYPPLGDHVPLDLAPRPFLITQGRTQGSSEAIAFETQVVATEHGLTDRAYTTFERRDIVELCREPMSVAEISARLGLHLNVVRVLVGDLYAEGRVLAHLAEFDASRDVDTLRRVISGLRSIC